MKRSIFPNSVEVDQSHLAYTESTKIEQLLFRTISLAHLGVVTGLQVGVNGINTSTVDVAPGSVFVPNGELAEVTSIASGVVMADNTNGVVNYVCVDYSETSDGPEPNENGLTIEMTRVEAVATVIIRTEAQYNALLSSQLANIAVIAKIVATGAAISPTLITQSVDFTNILAPSQPTLISGVSIQSIDFSTPPGDAVLDYDASPANGDDPSVAAPRIRWKSPGDSSFGTYVDIMINGTYTLYSASGHGLQIVVVAVSLSGLDVVETISVESLYAQDINRLHTPDALHRQMVGTGTPTINNPHGLTLNDLGGSQNQFVEEHQLLEHSNGIRSFSNDIFLSTAVIQVPGPSPDYVSITGPIVGDVYYVNGKQLNSITGVQIAFLINIVSAISLYEIILDEVGAPARTLRLQFPAIPTITGVAIIDCDDAIGAGNFDLQYDRTTRIMSFNSGVGVLIRADGNYTLQGADGKWIKVNVGYTTSLGFGVLPTSGGPTFIDSIQFFAPNNRLLNFIIASVVWDGAGALGWTESIVSPKVTTDKRMFGMTGLPDLRTDALNKDLADRAFTYVVGNGNTTFGDYNGPGAIQTALNEMVSAGVTGTIFVKSGTYDPFVITASGIKIIGDGGVTIDGISSAITAGALISITGSNNRLYDLTLANATTGIQIVSGDDNKGWDLIWSSGITTRVSVTAGSRNYFLLPSLTDVSVGDRAESDDFIIANSLQADVDIQAALDFAALGGTRRKRVFVHSGTYNISRTLNIPSNIELVGAGRSTIFAKALVWNGSSPSVGVALQGAGSSISNIKIQGFSGLSEIGIDMAADYTRARGMFYASNTTDVDVTGIADFQLDGMSE
jgi:hypothetical protein